MNAEEASLLRMAGEELGIDPLVLLEGLQKEEWRRQMADAIQLMLGERPFEERAWLTNAPSWML